MLQNVINHLKSIYFHIKELNSIVIVIKCYSSSEILSKIVLLYSIFLNEMN